MSAIKATLAQIWRRPGGRFGLVVLAGLVLLALSADFLASDKPIVLSLDGELYFGANLTDPLALRTHTVESLSHSMSASDWMIAPPIPWGPNQQDTGRTALAAPNARHWLGTDTARRDVMARLIHGARVSLFVSLFAVAIYVGIGTLLGLLAAYVGGWVDIVISRVTEIFLTVPVFFLILAVMGVVERAGIGSMVAVIGLVYWTRVARLVRSEALRVRQLEYVQAAVALGLSAPRIMLRHILPNTMGPILVTATFGIAGTILLEAALSFLGFGTPDTTASWGGLMRGAMGNFHAWWLALFPGLTIFITVTAFNIAGEALRDALDPRLRSERL